MSAPCRTGDIKRYGLYTCGVVCGYMLVFIVGPFFFCMGLILVVSGLLFSADQLWSGGWIFTIIGITLFIVGHICSRVLGNRIEKGVAKMIKENEPALKEALTAWNEAIISDLQNGGSTRHEMFFPAPFMNTSRPSPSGFPQPPPYPGRQQQSTQPPAYSDHCVNIPDDA